MKTVQKKDIIEKVEEVKDTENRQTDNEESVDGPLSVPNDTIEFSVTQSDSSSAKSQPTTVIETELPQKEEQDKERSASSEEELPLEKNDYLFDDNIILLTYKRNGLLHLKDKLMKDMQIERREIEHLRSRLASMSSQSPSTSIPKPENLDEFMGLLQKENQILQIKKINLVREIVEQKETCIELSAQLKLAASDKYSTNF